MQRIVLAMITTLCLVVSLTAEVPRTISYQGRLADSGLPVNGVKSVSFTIYSGGGLPVWNSGYVSVNFADGLFTVELGKSPQPPMLLDEWGADTAMTLGITIAPNPELSPRLRFTTTPYAMHAMHAMTAGRADVGGGWLYDNGLLSLENPNDSIGVGTTSPQAKVGLSSSTILPVFRVYSSGPVTTEYTPVVEMISLNTTGAVMRRGNSWERPASPLPALYAIANVENGAAAWFTGYSTTHATLLVDGHNAGGAINTWNPFGYALDAWWGKGIRVVADSATIIRAESRCGDRVATILSSAYTGTMVADHVAVSGYSCSGDWYGLGGVFEGGYVGVSGRVYPSGNNIYYGVRGEVGGGTGLNIGVLGSTSGSGTNYGVYGFANNGSTNWAGYFDGDINVTGSVVKAASVLAIDNPADPDNSILQQAEVVSDNLSAVYSGNVTLDGNGSATVHLPNWLESFCGDFRYQLTCIGGYAPVYVSSRIADSKFSIAGGNPGLEVSWQVTGIRKDSYAQAHPLAVERSKAVSEKGKYLHPEALGYSAERGLGVNPELNAAARAKDDAVRAATAALTKPSTPPQRPVTTEEK